MSEKKVQVLRFYNEGVTEVSYIADTSTSFDAKIHLPFDIPIISSHQMVTGKMYENKANEIFKAITGYDMPRNMIAIIPEDCVTLSDTCIGYQGSNYKNNQYIILENRYDNIYLVDGFTFPYFQLLQKDIFVIYITDKEDDKKAKESINDLERKVEPYILEKRISSSDFFNYGSYHEMTHKDCLTLILRYQIYNTMKTGCSKEDIAFLIVYDNVSVDKIMETEQIAQKIKIYYESILVGEKKGNVYSIDSIDDSHISLSILSLPVFGENVIKLKIAKEGK